MLEEDG
jgi:predicted RNA binding protein YcfA (HicA-like mRNA interferase family)/predicted RNase H-like HicB family nuclease